MHVALSGCDSFYATGSYKAMSGSGAPTYDNTALVKQHPDDRMRYREPATFKGAPRANSYGDMYNPGTYNARKARLEVEKAIADKW